MPFCILRSIKSVSYLQSIGFQHATHKITGEMNGPTVQLAIVIQLSNVYAHLCRDVILIIDITRMLSLKSHASLQVSSICNRNINVHKQFFLDLKDSWKCASLYLSKFTSRQKFTLRDWCLLNFTYDERRHIMELNGIAVLWLKIEVAWFGFSHQ